MLEATTGTADKRRTSSHSNPRKMASLSAELTKLYACPLPASRKGVLYNAFSYPTKISPEAIAVFIATHTRPGDVVLDTFGGSGTTGLAALLCDRPTDTMRQIAEEAGVDPDWGPRKAVIQDVGALGAFVAKALCSPPNPHAFRTAARELVEKVEGEFGTYYGATDPNGQAGSIRHVIWTEFLRCAQCRNETSFWTAAVRFEPLRILDTFRCPHCRKAVPMDAVERVTETLHDSALGTDVTRRKRRPARVHGETAGKNWQREANSDDEDLLAEVEGQSAPQGAPIRELVWGELFRSGYHTGISHLHHLYTDRNFRILTALWQAIGAFPDDVQEALRLLVLSYNAPHSTLMTRVVVKKGQKDFVLTGAQSGVLYVSGLPVEKNIFEGLRRKSKTIQAAFELVHGSKSEVEVVHASSTTLRLADSSVAYVFTDPPFGDYIPYAEVNQVSEAWLGDLTDRKSEIVVSPSGGKSVADYGRMMAEVFAEIARVLKPDGKATVVFHSAKADIWQALVGAYARAGFAVEATSVLDKLQDSFKQVVSTVTVKGDPLLLLTKSDKVIRTCSVDEAASILDSLVAGLSPKQASNRSQATQERLFSLFVGRCLESGMSIPMDADSFYSEVRRLRAAA